MTELQKAQEEFRGMANTIKNGFPEFFVEPLAKLSWNRCIDFLSCCYQILPDNNLVLNENCFSGEWFIMIEQIEKARDLLKEIGENK